MKCVATKNKKSDAQCQAKALFGHSMCGKHAHSKNPRIWSVVNFKKIEKLVRLQAIIRGKLVRERLKLAGSLVLKRKELVNDEDTFSGTPKEECHPMNFISITEDNKVFWFEFNNLWKWIIRSPKPINPYTNQLIPLECLTRLRRIFITKRLTDLPPESDKFAEKIEHRWNTILHSFHASGFHLVSKDDLMDLSPFDVHNIVWILYSDLESQYVEYHPLREKYISRCNMLRKISKSLSISEYFLQCLRILFMTISEQKKPDQFIFMLISTLYRI
jgi:hypothetical protein